MPDNSFIDVAGGWHDATDYLQYVTTSANATYQMLAAYAISPVFLMMGMLLTDSKVQIKFLMYWMKHAGAWTGC